jgi:hypothetical protein
MKTIPNFKDFYAIFEDNSEGDPAINLITSNFFQIYSNIVPLIGGYTDAIKDIKEIQAESVEKKVEKFIAIINKIAGLVENEDIKSILNSEELKEILKKLSDAYSLLIEKADDQEKKNIAQTVTSICIDQVEALTKAVKSISESYLENDNNFLFEKKLFKEERDQITKKITAAEGNMAGLIANPPSEGIKTKLQPIYDELLKLKTEVSGDNSDEEFSKIAKRKRVEKIEQISKRTEELEAQKNQIIAAEAEKIGLDKNVKNILTEASELIVNFLAKLNGQFTKDVSKSASEDAESGEETKEDTKEETKSTLVSGKKDPENLRKKGKNLKDIQKLQTDINKILEISGKQKIKEDGLFGDKTEKAIAQISKALSIFNSDLKSDGTQVSGKLQAALSKIAEDPAKLKEIFNI